jgi:hypothetical protein
MKKYVIYFLVPLLFCIVSEDIIAQGKLKSNLFLGIGRPTHPDMDFNENRLLLSLNYRHNFSKVLNWSLFVQRTSANSELDFINNKPRLLEYVNSSDKFGISSDWNSIQTYSFGGSLNLVFINKSKHYFSLNLGAGFYTSKSTKQDFSEVTTQSTFTPQGEFISSEITDFVVETDEATKTEPFIMPSLQYQYIFKNNYILGVGVDLLLDQDSDAITSHPVLANFYSFNIHFGKAF